MHFPHFLFICESVEAIYGGTADDAAVVHVMQAILGILWLVGVLLITLAAPLIRKMAARRLSSAAR